MIAHNLPTLGLNEQKAINNVIASGWVAQGPEVEAFEDELCEFFGLPKGHSVVVSSGSAALFMALWALDCHGQRVGLPVYSCSALRNAIGLVGAQPVYLDCKDGSPNLDLEAAQLSNLHTLISPSMFGLPTEIDPTRKYLLIEDLAQAFGAQINEKPVGLRGELGICSFYATKLFTSGGQGGAVISRDLSLIDKIRDYREFDNRRDRKLRFNLQMTDLQAAVGRVQLKRLPDFIRYRNSLFEIYRKYNLNLLVELNSRHNPVRYRAVISTKYPKDIIRSLDLIKVRAIVPIEVDELLDDPDQYPVAKKLATNTVSLPIYPNLTTKIVHKISKCIVKYIDT